MGFSVGIDLGTTYSTIAVAHGGTMVEVIKDGAGQTSVPSVVNFPERGAPIVGWEARARIPHDPMHTVFSAKRLIGRRGDDPAVRIAEFLYPFAIRKDAGEDVMIEIRGELYTIPQISAEVLRYLRSMAERHLGQPVTDAVMTVPANFTETQRLATRTAGKLAGLNIQRILSEPTAAALAYGSQRIGKGLVAVFDWGGGTLDFSLLDVKDRVFQVIATAGDMLLGGDDFDLALAGEVARAFEAKSGINLRRDIVEWQRVVFACEEAKRNLSAVDRYRLEVREVAHRASGPVHLSVNLSRTGAERLWRPLVERALAACQQALTDAGVKANKIDDLILVGGSTMVPAVRKAVADFFGRPPRTAGNPLSAVAAGAAIHAASFSSEAAQAPKGKTKPVKLIDVVPGNIGIAAAGGRLEAVIARNSAVPVKKVRHFSTSRDNQTELTFKIYQGDGTDLATSTLLGVFKVQPLRAAKAGEIDLEVTFDVDRDGMLSVEAKDVATGAVQTARLQVGG